jgi:hypothetical protein
MPNAIKKVQIYHGTAAGLAGKFCQELATLKATTTKKQNMNSSKGYLKITNCMTHIYYSA